MPDIMIRGMEMPESCEECVTKHKFFRELKCADLPGMRNFGENRLYTGNRNPHCPISKLPPHGDLISKDDAMNAILGTPPEAHYPSWYASIVNEIPAIVPSNKEETE